MHKKTVKIILSFIKKANFWLLKLKLKIIFQETIIHSDFWFLPIRFLILGFRIDSDHYLEIVMNSISRRHLETEHFSDNGMSGVCIIIIWDIFQTFSRYIQIYPDISMMFSRHSFFIGLFLYLYYISWNVTNIERIRSRLWHAAHEHELVVKHYDQFYYCQNCGTYI